MPIVRLFACVCLGLATAGCLRIVNNGGGDDLDTVLAEFEQPDCQPGYLAECKNPDIVFVCYVDIDAGITRFFNATTGEHLGTSINSIFGNTISLAEFSCPKGTVIEALCGSSIEVETEVKP